MSWHTQHVYLYKDLLKWTEHASLTVWIKLILTTNLTIKYKSLIENSCYTGHHESTTNSINERSEAAGRSELGRYTLTAAVCLPSCKHLLAQPCPGTRGLGYVPFGGAWAEPRWRQIRGGQGCNWRSPLASSVTAVAILTMYIPQLWQRSSRVPEDKYWGNQRQRNSLILYYCKPFAGLVTFLWRPPAETKIIALVVWTLVDIKSIRHYTFFKG